MSVLSAILTINTHLTLVLTVIPNMALIYLSFTSRVPEIRGFRVIIAAQSITEILTAIEMSLTEMGIFEFANKIYVIMVGIVVSMPSVTLILYGVHNFLVNINICLIPVVFLYRFAHICDNQMLKKLFTPIGGIYIAVVLFTANAFITTVHLSNVKPFYGNKINAILNKQRTFLLELTLTYADDTADVGKPVFMQVLAILACLIWVIELFGSYVIVCITTRKILKKLRTAATSLRARLLLQQLTTVMLLQASFPLVFMFVPIGLFYVISFTSIDAMEYGSIVMILFNWQTVVNPFITIYFISPFRDRILRFIPYYRNYGNQLVKCTTMKRNENSTSIVARTLEYAKIIHKKSIATIQPYR